MHVVNPRYVQRWRILSVSYRFHSGFIVGFIPESEKVAKRGFRAEREVPQRIKVGASCRFHTGFTAVSYSISYLNRKSGYEAVSCKAGGAARN